MKPLCSLLIAILVASLTVGQAIAQEPQDKPQEELKDMTKEIEQANTDLETLTKEIAALCSQPGFRGFLRSEIAKSKNRENILELSKFLDRAAKKKDMPPGLTKLKENAGKAEGRVKSSGLNALDGYDLYIPVDAHRAKWKGGEDFLVAYSPAGDEANITEIIAFSVKTGERVTLDPNKVPEQVVLVLALEEHETHEVEAAPEPEQREDPPAPVSKEEAKRNQRKPTGDEPRDAEGNSRFQYRYLTIYDDQEPWTRGDPEIYVVFCQGRSGRPDVHRVSLSWVNNENRQYWVGSSGYLYFYFDSNSTNRNLMFVMEQDGGSWFVNGTSWDGIRYTWNQQTGDDSVGYSNHYKSWYNWNVSNLGLYAGPGAYFKVGKYH